MIKTNGIKHFYCGKCGQKVKFCKKNLTQFCQNKINNFYLVHISYSCEKCNQITTIILTFKKSLFDIMKRVGLYSKNNN